MKKYERQSALSKLDNREDFGFGIRNRTKISTQLLRRLILEVKEKINIDDFLITTKYNKIRYSGSVYGKNEIIIGIPDKTDGYNLDKDQFKNDVKFELHKLKKKRVEENNWRKKELWLEI